MIPAKKDIVDGIKELSAAELNQVLTDAKYHEMEISETIVVAGLKKLRPHKARIIVSDCNLDKEIVISSLKEKSHQEIAAMFSAAHVPIIVKNEIEIAEALRGFSTCQQKAVLAAVSESFSCFVLLNNS